MSDQDATQKAIDVGQALMHRRVMFVLRLCLQEGLDLKAAIERVEKLEIE